MTRRRSSGIYYVKRAFRGIGRVEKSLGTRNKTRADVLEAMLVSLHAQGRLDLIRAFHGGEVGIEELAEAYEAGRIHELSARLSEANAPLSEGCSDALRLKAPDVTADTLAGYTAGLTHFQRFAGDVTVREALTTDKVQEFKAFRIAEGVKKSTVNNDLIAISILATHALDRDWISKRPKIGRFKPKTRINYIERGQINPYMVHLRRQYRPLFQLLLGSGMRLGEAEALRVCDLKLGTEARAQINDAKSEAGVRSVFLPPWVADTLRAHIEERSLDGLDLLFTMKRRTTQKEHNRACTAAGIHGYTIHDHRHTAAVHLARSGMPLNLLQNQLGHATIAMTMKYATFHPNYSDVGRYFEAVGKELGLVDPGDSLGDTPETAPLDSESADDA